MKYLLLIACLVSVSAFAKNGKVPMSWISDEALSEEMSLDSTDSMGALDEAYNNILDAKLNLFNTVPDDSHKHWQLQSIKSEIAVEGAGNIGVMGVGGEAAVELVWIKKGTTRDSTKMLRPALSEVAEADVESVNISSQMTEEAITKEIAPIVDLAMATGHVKKRKKLFENLFNEALKFQNTIRELESSPALGPWYAYKYQLELFVSADGHVGVIEIGNSLRLRMEWWRIKKNNQAPFQIPEVLPTLSENAKFVTALASDLEAVDQVEFDNGFRLNAMKVAVGTTIEGDFFFVSAKAKAVGAIFFKRDELAPSSSLMPALFVDKSEYFLKQGEKAHSIPRYNLAASLQKSANISKFFASRARSNENSKFELNVIETEFEVYRTGGIGLVSVENSASISLFITRNVSI